MLPSQTWFQIKSTFLCGTSVPVLMKGLFARVRSLHANCFHIAGCVSLMKGCKSTPAEVTSNLLPVVWEHKVIVFSQHCCFGWLPRYLGSSSLEDVVATSFRCIRCNIQTIYGILSYEVLSPNAIMGSRVTKLIIVIEIA